mmetsp:Transcript_14694/g.44356  ORF Transcript_14694/g.44356 Transcript_14694/m.44356 type:complete len:126 (-) Transcript_14694:439-816(-)|eukprot:CAMPEP_0206135432 /NCGR_PEP_ID=MMETSP1473-20131121/722_1 /ASSEMBLY_ACC=CAM_ASM_001109 /TAXON_ID=1461547 /ORGANISM="Stichococcus sp, Strain RCC1054" /LENGTH=125 /DNA_ID=CAMNT_0053527297 /DNA_START=155 /DNA_END=532 /DNA_ORIENTATION=-
MVNHKQDLETQDRLTKNVKDLLWLHAWDNKGGSGASVALKELEAHGPASDGSHGSNVSAILKSLASDSAKAAEAEKYGFSKYVAELSLEELMAANLSGGEDTEEVLGWASGAKYEIKKPALFGKS